jgi:hypothetical protein
VNFETNEALLTGESLPIRKSAEVVYGRVPRRYGRLWPLGSHTLYLLFLIRCLCLWRWKPRRKLQQHLHTGLQNCVRGACNLLCMPYMASSIPRLGVNRLPWQFLPSASMEQVPLLRAPNMEQSIPLLGCCRWVRDDLSPLFTFRSSTIRCSSKMASPGSGELCSSRRSLFFRGVETWKCIKRFYFRRRARRRLGDLEAKTGDRPLSAREEFHVG